jgi:hypothetical protein
VDTKNISKCRHFETCDKIQKGILLNDWKGVEDTLIYAIKKTCGNCQKFEAKTEKG